MTSFQQGRIIIVRLSHEKSLRRCLDRCRRHLNHVDGWIVSLVDTTFFSYGNGKADLYWVFARYFAYILVKTCVSRVESCGTKAENSIKIANPSNIQHDQQHQNGGKSSLASLGGRTPTFTRYACLCADPATVEPSHDSVGTFDYD